MNLDIEKNFKDSKVLILGGTGFIGTNLVQRLSNMSGHIFSIQKNMHNINDNQKNVSYITHNFSKEKDLIKTVKKINPDYVFNVSGYIDHSPFFKGGYNVIKNHYMETLTLLEALGEIDIKSYIHTGSSDEYGISLSPQKESQRESPMTPYSASKVSLTHTLQAITHSDNFPAIILKLFIVYGPHQQPGRLIPDVITSLLSGREVNVSSGEQKRDFCFVSDIVDAFLLASTNSNAIGQVINLGSGKSIAVKDIVREIERKIGKGKVNFGTRKIRDNENLDLYPDITFAKKTLEWQPLTKIDLGLDLTIEHYRNILE